MIETHTVTCTRSKRINLWFQAILQWISVSVLKIKSFRKNQKTGWFIIWCSTFPVRALKRDPTPACFPGSMCETTFRNPFHHSMPQIPICKALKIFLITYISTFKIYSWELFIIELVSIYSFSQQTRFLKMCN